MGKNKTETFELAYRLAPIFSTAILNEIVRFGESKTLKRIVREHSAAISNYLDQTVADLYERAYAHLYDGYRNEYVFKNVMANSILLGRHSPNTSTMLSEFRVGGSKADIVFVNGTSQAYEIKTEFDGLDRLDGQLSDYQKCFDKVSVVTSARHLPALENSLDSKVGLFLLTRRGSISSIREPVSNVKNLRPDVMFDSLRMREYVPAINRLAEMPRDVPNALVYKQYKEVFANLAPEVAHDILVEALKNRGRNKAFVKLISSMPNSLKAAVLPLRVAGDSASRLLQLLREPASRLVT